MKIDQKRPQKALSARLKSTSIKVEHTSPQKSSPVKLESKESIVEIKQLRTKIANLENDLNSKDLEMKCLQQAWFYWSTRIGPKILFNKLRSIKQEMLINHNDRP